MTLLRTMNFGNFASDFSFLVVPSSLEFFLLSLAEMSSLLESLLTSSKSITFSYTKVK